MSAILHPEQPRETQFSDLNQSWFAEWAVKDEENAFLNSKELLHLEEAEKYIADTYKVGTAAMAGGSITVLTGLAIGRVIEESQMPLLSGAWKEAAENTPEALGIYGAGLFAIVGLSSMVKRGTAASYHMYRAWVIQRRESRAKKYENMFYWPISPNNSHLNGNL